jgi:DNA-binding response OmpR family regulator
VVEDEPVVRGLIVETLNKLGYSAIEADDGPKGVEILRSPQRIDLLVTDVGLPGLFAAENPVHDRLRRERGARLRLLEPGMVMITKPFAMQALAARIRTILETRSDR